MVRELKTKADYDTLLKEGADQGKVVILDFTATWCPPCRAIGPIFVKLAEEFPTILCAKVDVDENAETSEAEGISAMPTFKVYKDGKEVGELVGASEAKLKELFEKNK